MSIVVWHSRKHIPGEPPPKFNFTHFKPVALVDGGTLDTAFRDTNHIDRPWWENRGVTLVGEKTHRSTSVGDIIVVDGKPMRCARAGWEEVR